MSDAMLLIDTNAIINLFAARGRAGWDSLLDSGKRVAILYFIVEDELGGAVIKAINDGASLPDDLADQFRLWVSEKPDAVRIDYKFPQGDPEIYKPNGDRKIDAGDRLIKRFLQNSDPAAIAAKQAAGIGADTKYLFLTDDTDLIRSLRNLTDGFKPEQMAAKGLYDFPYQGTPGFWATRFVKGDITEEEYLAAKASFEASGRNQKLSVGFNTGVHGEAKLFNLKDSWLNQDQLGRFMKSTGEKVWGFLKNESGSMDPEVALKGGVSGRINRACCEVRHHRRYLFVYFHRQSGRRTARTGQDC